MSKFRDERETNIFHLEIFVQIIFISIQRRNGPVSKSSLCRAKIDADAFYLYIRNTIHTKHVLSKILLKFYIYFKNFYIIIISSSIMFRLYYQRENSVSSLLFKEKTPFVSMSSHILERILLSTLLRFPYQKENIFVSTSSPILERKHHPS